jgi:hypothetical protein
MPSEGRVFVCSWKEENGRFRVWVKRRPKLVAHGATFVEADEELSGVICTATGDGESLHEYDPPPPEVATDTGLIFRLARVSGQSPASILNPEALFEDGFCSSCTKPRGARTSAALVLDSIKSGDDGGATQLKNGRRLGRRGPRLHFFSEAFLGLLVPTERDQFDWRRVERTGRSKKVFYELVGSSTRIPLCALAAGNAWLARCDVCGYENDPNYGAAQSYPYWLLDAAEGHVGLPSSFVNVADLPKPLPSCFTVGAAPLHGLCFTKQRWRELVGRPGTRGISSAPVGVVTPARVDLHPRWVRRSLA